MTGQRPSALRRLTEAKPVATPADAVATPKRHDSATAARHDGGTVERRDTAPLRRHDGTTARRQRKYTVVMYDELVGAFDRLAVDVSERVGRRVEKAEIVRALIAAATSEVAVRDVLDDAVASGRWRETRARGAGG